MRLFSADRHDDPKQALRMRRHLIADGTSLLVIGLFFICYTQNILDASAFAIATALTLVSMAGFYAMFRSRLNLRMRDPSLTLPQMLAATATVLYAAFAAHDSRWIFLLMLPMILLFGVLRLGTKALLAYVGFVLLAYLGIIAGLAHFRAGAVDLRSELTQWVVFAAALPWFALMGGYLTQLRSRLRDQEAFYRSIYDASADTVLVLDSESCIRYANPAVEAMFGYTPAEVMQHDLALLQPERLREAHREGMKRYLASGMKRTKRTNWHAAETKGLHRDGHEFPIEIAFSEVERAGKRLFAGFIRDTTERTASIGKILRLSNLYAALSQAGHAITRVADRDALLQELCRIAVHHGHFRMAWVGFIDPETQRVCPVASSGVGWDYLDSVMMSVDPDIPEGQGPLGIALRRGEHALCNDFMADPTTRPWRDAAGLYGFASTAVFPLKQDGRVCGALTVYAGEIGYFDEQLLDLLRQLASDISYALDNIRREERRRGAEEELRLSEERFRLLADNMSDLVAVLDRDGKVRNIESIGSVIKEASGEVFRVVVARDITPRKQIEPRASSEAPTIAALSQ